MTWKKEKQNLKTILEAVKPQLTKKRNVIGVGIGKKVIRGRITETPALIVYVSKKVSPHELREKDIIPRMVEGVPTDVIQAGKVEIQPYKKSLLFRPKGIDRDRTKRFDPVPVGVSIGEEHITSGTSNVIVVDENGQLNVTSNSHILTSYLATCAMPEVGEKIYQPGPVFGKTPPENWCAVLNGWEPITPTIIEGDFAYARIKRQEDDDFLERNWTNVLFGVGELVRRVMAEDEIEPGMEIIKDGLNGVMNGKIFSIDTEVQVNYRCEVKWVKNNIVLSPVSEPGDSGSPIVLKSTPSLHIGYVYGGSTEVTVVTPAWLMFKLHILKLWTLSYQYKPAEVTLKLIVLPPEAPPEGKEVILEAQLDKDTARSGEEVTVFGSLKEKETKQPIKNAPIVFYMDGNKLGSTTTDENGQYSFRFYAPYVTEQKEYTILVKFPGM